MIGMFPNLSLYVCKYLLFCSKLVDEKYIAEKKVGLSSFKSIVGLSSRNLRLSLQLYFVEF